MKEKLLPDYEKIHDWELWSRNLKTEYRQCIEEGKDVEKYKDLFLAISNMENGEIKEKFADVLFELTEETGVRDGYKYVEPSDIESIHKECEGTGKKTKCPKDEISDRVLGGWYGRICGCFLGKPIEGGTKEEIDTLLKATGNYPISRYIDKEDLKCDVPIRDFLKERLYPKDFGRMPVDDDTNYILIGYEILKRYGRNFTSEDVMRVWLSAQVKDAYCTAERIAFKNFVNGFLPPDSAKYKNAYREWIGAQIRGDFFGYINPGDPRSAADMAFRDAAISHVKNGIYGEMWASAMIAAAFTSDNVKDVIKAGLDEIPKNSRLHEAILRVISDYENGVSSDEFFDDFHKRYDECDSHDWCHTISNAEIVAASLLYGGGDYAKSICLAVFQGFDTDCNGATVGSVLGVLLGYKNLPTVWTERINDTLESSLFGYTTVSVKEMAEKTLQFID